MSTSSKPVHVLIFGSGAVGLFYGSRLHQPSASPPVLVSLICRSNYNVVSQSGVQLETRDYGNYHFAPHKVFKTPEEAAKVDWEWDTVVVATKALPELGDKGGPGLLRPLYNDKGKDGGPAIVLIQNGVAVEEPWRRAYPGTVIVSGVTVVSAEQVGDGLVKQYRWTRISLGSWMRGRGEGEERKEGEKEFEERGERKTKQVKEWLVNGGVKDAEALDEIGLQLVRWHKIAINGSMNPSAVLSGGSTNASMASDPELRIHLRGCMDEIFETAPKVLERPWPEKLLKASPEVILKSTERNAGGRSSMLVDWEKGRPMEIEAILGNPVRIAREKGFEMRRLQTLYGLLKMAQRRREEDKEAKAKL